MNFVEEMQWRGMIHQTMRGTEELLADGMVTGYIGFDPTSDSLGIGNMVQIMSLVHFQRCGHKPIALVGGATGMVGDPSGKSAERNLLDEATLQKNIAGQRKQLEKFLDFDCGENSAVIVNNFDWFKEFGFLEFIRDVGKHITVSYMNAKDSVKSRMETGLSFTEYSYQLVQGYDFYHLWKEHGCKLQMGGSDQWGNITTGSELIRRMAGGEAFALTTPLIKKADGTKFGKSEGGNIWLDKTKTSVYKFYQYWVNATDDDVANYIRIFSLKGKEEIDALQAEHDEVPGRRKLQYALAEELTIRVHGQEEYDAALAASGILFGKGTADSLREMDEGTFKDVFSGVPQGELTQEALKAGVSIIDVLADTGFMKSKGEARRNLQQNAVSVNKDKVTDAYSLSGSDLIGDRYILLSHGKKTHFLLTVN